MPKRDTPSVELTDSLVTLYTVSSGYQLTLIELIFHNRDTSSRLITVHLVPSGGAAGDSNELIGSQSGTNELKKGETRAYRFNLFKDPGSFIQAKADVTSKVTMFLNALEETP